MFASTLLSWLLGKIYDLCLCLNFFSSPLCARTDSILDKKNYWIHREYTSSLSHRSGPYGVWVHLHDYHGFWVKFMMCLYIRTFFPLPCMHGWSHSWTRKIIGYMGSILPSSHIIVDPMVCGTHPDVRGREHTPKVPNNNPLGNGRHTY